MVAPHTGAWIETNTPRNGINALLSHPTRVRGLKHIRRRYRFAHAVAPHTGAWIETKAGRKYGAGGSRTPHGCVD